MYKWILKLLTRKKYITGSICTSEIAIIDPIAKTGIPHSHILLTVVPEKREELIAYFNKLNETEMDVLVQYPKTMTDCNKWLNYITKTLNLKEIYNKGFNWNDAANYNRAFKNAIEEIDCMLSHSIRTNVCGSYKVYINKG
jgi:hypothetical protein